MSNKIAADYTLTPGTLSECLELLIRAKRPAMVWGPPGVGKSQVAQQVAKKVQADYKDIRALLLDPVDLRGLPWRDGDTTHWASPDFLPPQDSKNKFLINLEELPAAPPMVQAALYQLVLDRAIGEYKLPEGANVIACGNRESDRGVSHRMPAPLASRFVHLEVEVDVEEWKNWAATADIAVEVLFFIQLRPDLLHDFDPTRDEKAFPSPRGWEFVSDIINARNGMMDAMAELAIYRGTVGEGAAVEFKAFLKIMRELPHPQTIINDPKGAAIPDNASTLIALCGSLYRTADDVNFEAIAQYAARLRPEIGEFLMGMCVKKDPALQSTKSFIQWAQKTH